MNLQRSLSFQRKNPCEREKAIHVNVTGRNQDREEEEEGGEDDDDGVNEKYSRIGQAFLRLGCIFWEGDDDCDRGEKKIKNLHFSQTHEV